VKTSQRYVISATLIGAMLALSGCAQLMGALRRDLDDGDAYSSAPPTTGGRWAERGFLSEDMPEGGSVGDRYVGHSERNPASGSYGRGAGGRSWVNSDNEDANRRDMARGESGDDDAGPNANSTPNMDPGTRRQYKNGMRATRADFVDESQNEGSLWASDGQTNYYFTKNKIRGVGDIITINVEQDLVRDVGLEARRTLTSRERDYELNAAQARLQAKAMGLPSPDGDSKDQVASAAAAPARAPAAAPGTPGAAANGQAPAASEVAVPQATSADVDVSKSLGLKAGDTMMGEIVERYPNGNYKVRATKKVPYKGGAPRLVTMVGVVKGSDIGEDDTVPSGKLYEYRIDAAR
jgi:flagellar L-ring protein precursor FlgH